MMYFWGQDSCFLNYFTTNRGKKFYFYNLVPVINMSFANLD